MTAISTRKNPLATPLNTSRQSIPSPPELTHKEIRKYETSGKKFAVQLNENGYYIKIKKNLIVKATIRFKLKSRPKRMYLEDFRKYNNTHYQKQKATQNTMIHENKRDKWHLKLINEYQMLQTFEQKVAFYIKLKSKSAWLQKTLGQVGSNNFITKIKNNLQSQYKQIKRSDFQQNPSLLIQEFIQFHKRSKNIFDESPESIHSVHAVLGTEMAYEFLQSQDPEEHAERQALAMIKRDTLNSPENSVQEKPRLSFATLCSDLPHLIINSFLLKK